MKLKDLILVPGLCLLFLPFILFEPLYEAYYAFNKAHGLLMSFFKFAVLATLGEMIGLRIRTGVYNRPGFGILPRAFVWGFLGMSIYMAFVIFAAGTPVLLQKMGMQQASALMEGGLSWGKLVVTLTISAGMNIFYAPVMMTFHKITDLHIEANGGTMRGLFRRMDMAELFERIDWKAQWGFVFKKTIPFFWIPAQALNFLLPEEWRILVAAIYGIILGILLAVAGPAAKRA